MKEIYAKAKTVPVAIAAAVSSVAALCLLTATTGAVFAQSSNSRPSPVERRTEILNQQAGQYDIEKANRDLKRPPETPTDRRRTQELEMQVTHDFNGLQESYNQIVIIMADKEGLNRNHDFVFRAVAEIKKYSTRLKTNLALPKPQQEKARVETNNEPIEESLMTLRKHIYNFATNPLFASPGALDLEQGRKAARDLDRIIELSESITKLKKLTKS